MSRNESFSRDDLVFHYNREDRIQHLSPETRERKRQGIFKSNRSVLLLLINIFVAAVFVFIVVPVLRNSKKQASYDNCVFSLKGFAYEDRAFVSLKATAIGDRTAPSENTVQVDFSLAKSGNRLKLSDILPVKKGQSIIIRGEMSLTAGSDTIQAEVSVGGKTLSLLAALELEE
ncbi:MAG: hypothetical protein E4H36_01400 [Spirochaetales bacterium]|nr:MAG: hypothetical protein E4H36_01400 [Spirochaetales bacterium]